MAAALRCLAEASEGFEARLRARAHVALSSGAMQPAELHRAELQGVVLNTALSEPSFRFLALVLVSQIDDVACFL